MNDAAEYMLYCMEIEHKALAEASPRWTRMTRKNIAASLEKQQVIGKASIWHSLDKVWLFDEGLHADCLPCMSQSRLSHVAYKF